MTKHKLFKAVSDLDITKKDQEYEIPGVLGFTLAGENTVQVPNRDSFVYVRLRNNQNELIQAFNDQVSPVYDLPVIVSREGALKTRLDPTGPAVGLMPNMEFIKLAKEKGVKFTLGTNNIDDNLGNLEYCLEALEECGLTPTDMWVPKTKLD